MPNSASLRAPLLTAAFVSLAAFATWSFTSIGHPEVQLTVKNADRAAAGAPAPEHRAAIPAKPSRS